VRTELLSYWLFVGVVVHVGAHVALLVGLFRARSFYMGILSLALPPLAPYYGWRRGMRKRTFLWLSSLGAYALGVVFANL
jgi:hypothetical protein